MRKASVGLIAVWAVASLELVFVLALHRAELNDRWEARMGATFLAPTALLLSAPLGLLAAVLFHGMIEPSRPKRWLSAGMGALGVGAVAGLVATGRHFDEPFRREGFALALGLVAGAAIYFAHPWLSAKLIHSSRGFALGALALGLVLEVCNRVLLVRLYPAFHSALAAASLLLAALAALSVFARRKTDHRKRIVAAALAALVLIAAAALAQPAAASLARFDNFRLMVVDHSPLLADAVRAAALLSPPAPLDADPCEADPSSCPGAAPDTAQGPSFQGRDIVIVSIDALRADHVGAYGYTRPTTPHIDQLAADGVVFAHAYCPTPHTSYSVTSMMTGKYMRPLLLQGAGSDSETLATFVRLYGYKTAAFYPPAVFFIDQSRFESFERAHYGFEYRKVEFMEGEGRVRQVDAYLGRQAKDQRVLLWVHLFGPHEPYEAHAEHFFGDRDVDRYDSEIAAADDTVGQLVETVRKSRPSAVVIVTADHGEEFGEHGGRYHGTTVYEEQVRVPLVISAPGLAPAHRVATVVQTIDILPTILAALSIPPSPRIRGHAFGAALLAKTDTPGFAFAETEEQALLAEGNDRLVCARKLGACRLFDIAKDPGEREDVSASSRERFDKLRTELAALGASHGQFEREGLRAETGRGWPPPILRGIAGDADAAPELASLLDDSDRDIRRKSAELLYELHRAETVPSLTLSLDRDEDPVVRKFAALALTRLGQAAPLTLDVLTDPDVTWRRRAALALAESGDARGGPLLIEWWLHGGADDHDRALEVLAALARIRSKDAVYPLVHSLGDVRLRPRIAETLAAIGDSAARGPLAAALGAERFQTARVAIADALAALGAKEELARPLVRFLGVPDPLPGGLGYAIRAGVLEQVGGPDKKTLSRLVSQSDVGVRVHVLVPRSGGGPGGVRVLVRARADEAGQVRIGRSETPVMVDSKGVPTKQREAPRIHDRDYVALDVPASRAPVEVVAELPASLGARPGRPFEFVLYAERHVHVEALAVVPMAPELPPPPPEPWKPAEGDDSG